MPGHDGIVLPNEDQLVCRVCEVLPEHFRQVDLPLSAVWSVNVEARVNDFVDALIDDSIAVPVWIVVQLELALELICLFLHILLVLAEETQLLVRSHLPDQVH